MSKIRDALKQSQKENDPDRNGSSKRECKIAPTGVLPQDLKGLADSLQEVGEISATQAPWDLDGILVRGQVKDSMIAAEEMRKLTTILVQRKRAAAETTFMVTSALPGEGKTFLSVNLAWILAQAKNQRVLLIDGDLRNPSAHRMLGASRTPGLAEFLRGRAEVSHILQRGPLPNLFFLPAGDFPPNSMELLTGPALKNLLGRFSTLFDWILIDSPPVLSVSDVQLLAPLVQGIILVVGAGCSTRESGIKARDMLAGSGLLGVVLNYVEEKESYSSGYYDGYLEKHPQM